MGLQMSSPNLSGQPVSTLLINALIRKLHLFPLPNLSEKGFGKKLLLEGCTVWFQGFEGALYLNCMRGLEKRSGIALASKWLGGGLKTICASPSSKTSRNQGQTERVSYFVNISFSDCVESAGQFLPTIKKGKGQKCCRYMIIQKTLVT